MQKTRLIVKAVIPEQRAKMPPAEPLPQMHPSIPSTSTLQTPAAKPVISPKNLPVKKEAQKPVQKNGSPKTPSKKPAIPIELLQQLDRSLAKIEQAPKIERPLVKSSPSLPTLKIDHFGGEDSEYESELIHFLRGQLSLPEVGEVQMKLSLQNNGAFVKMEIVRTQSVKNRDYLQAVLPTLSFPLFMGMLAKTKEETFVITFSNE